LRVAQSITNPKKDLIMRVFVTGAYAAEFVRAAESDLRAATRMLLKWEPTHNGLLADLTEGPYFASRSTSR
jgi:hypothetical protein